MSSRVSVRSPVRVRLVVFEWVSTWVFFCLLGFRWYLIGLSVLFCVLRCIDDYDDIFCNRIPRILRLSSPPFINSAIDIVVAIIYIISPSHALSYTQQASCYTNTRASSLHIPLVPRQVDTSPLVLFLHFHFTDIPAHKYHLSL